MSENQKAALPPEGSASSDVKPYELRVGWQIFHMFLIAVMITPNLLYNAAVNALSYELGVTFNDMTINSLSYTFTAVPTIFSLIIFTILVDSAGTEIIMPMLQLCNICGGICGVVSIVNKSKAVFLVGRILFGIGGETSYAAQPKFITLIIRKSLHPIAFAIANAGQIAGELLAVLVLPIRNALTSYEVILGLQVLSLIIYLFYSFFIPHEIKKQIASKTKSVPMRENVAVTESLETTTENQSGHSTSQVLTEAPVVVEEQKPVVPRRRINFCAEFKSVLLQIKGCTPWYWCMAVTRIVFTATVKVYDSRSVIALTSIFHVAKEVVKRNVVYQFTASICTLLILAVIQKWMTQIHFFTTGGIVAVIVAMLIFCLAKDAVVLIPICVIEGIGVGLFISTTSCLLVRMAGGTIGASAVGIVFSFKYALISIMTPIVQKVAEAANQVANGWIYFSLHVVGLISICIAITKDPGLGWWQRKK